MRGLDNGEVKTRSKISIGKSRRDEGMLAPAISTLRPVDRLENLHP